METTRLFKPALLSLAVAAAITSGHVYAQQVDAGAALM